MLLAAMLSISNDVSEVAYVISSDLQKMKEVILRFSKLLKRIRQLHNLMLMQDTVLYGLVYIKIFRMMISVSLMVDGNG